MADPGWLGAVVAASVGGDIVAGALDDGPLNDPLVRAWRPPPQPGNVLPRPSGFLPAGASANLAIWRDVLEALGGWREDLIGGHEDTELCWRAQLSGHALVFAPEARMAYRYRRGVRPLALQAYRYGAMSALLFRTYRAYGMPRSRPRVALGAWARVVTELPKLRDPVARGRYVRRTAFHAGRLVGSVRHRVIFP